jgi:hypothetical protein
VVFVKQVDLFVQDGLDPWHEGRQHNARQLFRRLTTLAHVEPPVCNYTVCVAPCSPIKILCIPARRAELTQEASKLQPWGETTRGVNGGLLGDGVCLQKAGMFYILCQTTDAPCQDFQWARKDHAHQLLACHRSCVI